VKARTRNPINPVVTGDLLLKTPEERVIPSGTSVKENSNIGSELKSNAQPAAIRIA
jgi:hypothetical protein